MDAILEAQFLARARSRSFKNRKHGAIATIKRWLELCGREAYAAISGGKDSLVACALIESVCPGLPMIWVNQGPLAEWESCIKSLYALRDRGWNIIELCPPRSLWKLYEDYGIPLNANMDSALDKKINRALIYDVIDEWRESNPVRGYALGLRKESKGRTKLIQSKGNLFQRTDGLWECLPVANWMVDDIWAFILSEELPYASLYDRDPRNTRNGPPIGTTGAPRGRLAELRQNHPEYYQQFVNAFPEIAGFC